MPVGTNLNLHHYDFKDTGVPEQESLAPNPQGGNSPCWASTETFRMMEGASLTPDGLSLVVSGVGQSVAT